MLDGTVALENCDPIITTTEGSTVNLDKDANTVTEEVDDSLKLVISYKRSVKNLYLHYFAEVFE